MMLSSATPQRLAINVLTVLWTRPEWRTSTYSSTIHATLRATFDGSDEVNRLRAARVLRLLIEDGESAFDLVRGRLLAERHPYVAAALLGQLGTFIDSHAAAVDGVIAALLPMPPWADMLNSTERDHDMRDPIRRFIHIATQLAIQQQTPAASQLMRKWFTNPLHSDAASQAVGSIRGWLALQPDRAGERARAFELLDIAVSSLTQIRDDAGHDASTFRAAIETADTIAHNVYFASGAHADDGNPAQIPDQGFAELALPTLHALSTFKSPPTVHAIVQTLNHLAPLDPRQAFLIVNTAIATGDHYTYDQIAADEVTAMIERYLAEYRELIVNDRNLLSAIRSVLHAFVDAGWSNAINLAYRLSDAFR